MLCDDLNFLLNLENQNVDRRIATLYYKEVSNKKMKSTSIILT